MVKLLNVKNFANYNEHKKDVDSKIFLFHDREFNKKEVEHNGITYALDESTNIDLTGQITDPSRAIARSLFNSYEWSILKASFCDGYLFLYSDFAPGSESDHKQIKFKVYNLKKI